MSYEIVKSISIKNDEVWVRSCSNNVYPKTYESWCSRNLTEIYQTKGKEGLYKEIGESVWSGECKLQKGTKLCNLLLQAREQLPQHYNFTNLCSEAVSEYLKNAVLKLEQDKNADLSEEIHMLETLRNNREYILNAISTYGWNYLNNADLELQKDRELVREAIHASQGAAHFEYPQYFTGDKELAMESLLLNGCWYRQLDKKLRMDHDIILLAFDKSLGSQYTEHLPQEIPVEAFFYGGTPKTYPIDKEFLYTLMEVAPQMHMWHGQDLLQDVDDFIQWYRCARYKNEAMDLIVHATQRDDPPFTMEDLESHWFQKDLLDTCRDEVDKDILKEVLEDHDIGLNSSVFEKGMERE